MVIDNFFSTAIGYCFSSHITVLNFHGALNETSPIGSCVLMPGPQLVELARVD